MTDWDRTDEGRAYFRKYRETHPEMYRVARAKYDKAHPEMRKDIMRRWRQRNAAYRSAYMREWRKRQPREVLHALDQRMSERRRGRLRGVGTHTREEWLTVVAEQRGMCAYCGACPPRLTLDHVVPVAAGGSNTIDNIVGTCSRCNKKKHKMPLIVFLVRHPWETEEAA